MKLKKEARLVDFLQAAQRCLGEVYYKTTEGDVLNLKSQLSQYIFLAALASDKDTLLPNGEIHCADESDYQLLGKFLNP